MRLNLGCGFDKKAGWINVDKSPLSEPDELVEPSNELEEAAYEERKEINRILRELTKAIVQERKAILANVKTLSLIDLTYAKAQFSLAYDMAAPQLNPDGCLNLRQARHPLLLWWNARRPSVPLH